MAIQTASGSIYVHSPDHPKRSRIISRVAVCSVANVCWRVLENHFTEPRIHSYAGSSSGYFPGLQQFRRHQDEITNNLTAFEERICPRRFE